MLEKVLLTEQSIVYGEIESILTEKIDFEKIKKNIIDNQESNNFLSKDFFSDFKNYIKIDDDKNITWIHDYIRDHYRLQYKKLPVWLDKSGLIQKKNELINCHDHIDPFDLLKSPDLSCLYTLQTGKKNSYIVFVTKEGREKNLRWRVPVLKNRFYLFNSGLKHYFTPHDNEESNIFLSFKFNLETY